MTNTTSNHSDHETIIVLEGGGQYTQVIARRIREDKVFCEVLNSEKVTIDEIKKKKPRGIIISTENEVETALIEQEILGLGIPVLGIDNSGKQFYPTANQAEFSKQLIHRFLYEICGCAGDWTMDRVKEETITRLREKIGDKKVLCALSGGVDSTVAAVLIHQAVGDQLHCILVDHGLMRLNECSEVVKVFEEEFKINLTLVEAQERFLGKLKGISDPEQKRKIIGTEFIRVFEEEAKKIGKVDFLVQGTIYPDVIESGGGGAKGGRVIKSHHNVGGLPEVIDFEEIIEPLRDLFKDEVRALGTELGIPESLVWRQPFPGPGLGIRVIGEITGEKLDILRAADAIFREEIVEAGLHRSINQYFAVLTNMRSVGMKNGERTYDYALALRGVTTTDFMVAEWAKIPFDVLERVSSRIVSEVKNINRIIYDITPKPPATIEWE